MDIKNNDHFPMEKSYNLSNNESDPILLEEFVYVPYNVDRSGIDDNFTRKIKISKNRLMKLCNLTIRALCISQNILLKSQVEIEMDILTNIQSGNEASSENALSVNVMDTDIDFKLNCSEDMNVSEWEILDTMKIKEILRKNLPYCLEFEDYTIDVNSKILNSNQMNDLMKHMLPETIGSTLELVYSVDKDGWSLNTLYKKMADSSGKCCILLIQDSTSKIFGAMCNTNIRKSKSFYGNGLTFVFHWNPHFEKFTYSQKYSYFMYGNSDFFSIGCPKSAIRLEKSLFNGLSQQCDTFDSPPFVSSEYFDIVHLEVWGFF